MNRRTTLAGGAAAGVVALVAGCQTYGAEPPADGDAPLARTADIPVGGGAILAGRGVVVTQPEAGTFKAFSAACTHQGCAVTDVADGTINCACHGSRFAVADGSVRKGPATTALPPVAITVSGTEIRRTQ